MSILEMLEQSAILTVLGMTVVFVFLWIMLVCINLVGRLVHSLGWDKDVEPPKQEPVSQEITAAIIAAVTEYRKSELGHK
jgi:oxaloacetate decarboxylase gamma subunit